MKVPKLAFPAVAVVVAATIGLIYRGIIPTFKEVTATHHSQSAADNTKDDAHQEEPTIDQEAGLKPAASMFLLRAPTLLGNDYKYGSTLNNRNLLNSSCNNSPLKVLTGKARKSAKTCEYIAAKRKKLCKGRVIKSHCPDACGVCDSFGTADSEATFMYDGAKTDCAWLHGFLAPSTLWQISVLCKDDAIRETCRHTCSFFFHSCAMCSSEPTSRPSLEVMSNMPSSLPSTSSSLSPSTLPSKTPSTSPTTSLASPSTLPTLSPSTSASTSPSTSPTLSPSTLPSSSPSTLPSKSPSTSPTTSLSLSNPPSPPPTTQCQGKITSIINKNFGNVTKGPPQEEAYEWLIEDITDEECDNEAKILQRYILAVLYFSTGGEDWSDYYEGWLGSTSECDWSEVYCNDNQQVRTLELGFNNLNGTIPAELSSLTDLVHLYFHENNLSGTIPGSIFQLMKLEALSLYRNDLTGTIPDNFGGSSILRYITLFDNFLTGTIPEITGDSLQSIKELSLSKNILSGSIPVSILELPQLEYLYLYENELTGTIPDKFEGSSSLQYISFYNNLLTGTIPEITGESLQSIRSLKLHHNKMSGPVPDSICARKTSFRDLWADCDPPDNAQNPCPSGCCTACYEGKGLP